MSPLANLVDPGMLSSESPSHADDASLWTRVARDGWIRATKRSPSSACAATTPPASRSSRPEVGSACSSVSYTHLTLPTILLV